jgi:signal transduction histidine kinase
LAARLQTTREEESARIAREVHDELGQALTALKMDLAWVDHRLASGGNAEVSRAREKIVEMTQLIDATAQTVRRVATELRPGLLDDMGLVAAIESQVRDFQNRTGCRCEWELPAEPIQLDKQLATALFRVVQESLTNIARHAQATEARVRLQVVEGDLVLEIRDNGCGISEEKARDPASLGLLGMRERVFPFGGVIVVEGAPQEGTVVTVKVPLR